MMLLIAITSIYRIVSETHFVNIDIKIIKL